MAKPETSSMEVAARLKSVVDYVQDCERRVAQGEIMDLQGLDKNVIELCEIITAMPKKESRALESQMTRLIEALDHLAGSMKAQQDRYVAAGAR